MDFCLYQIKQGKLINIIECECVYVLQGFCRRGALHYFVHLTFAFVLIKYVCQIKQMWI